VESEYRRLVELRQVLTVEQSVALLAAVIDAVKRHVPDPAARSAIAVEFSHLVQIPTRFG
jgi:hypothetical protein